jgi:hypothetical protein
MDTNNDNAKVEYEYEIIEVDVSEGITNTSGSLGIGNESFSNGGFQNLEELKLSQDFASAIGVKKMLTTIPVRKPDKQKFVRVNPDSNYSLTVATIEVKDENETYIIHPQILPNLVEECNYKLLVVAITRQKVLFVWPLGLPGADGKDNPWHASAREAAEHAKKAWIRVVSNRELGAYEIFEAEGDLGEPDFPNLSMEEIIKISFRDKIITDLEHPLLQQLRGR